MYGSGTGQPASNFNPAGAGSQGMIPDLNQLTGAAKNQITPTTQHRRMSPKTTKQAIANSGNPGQTQGPL